MKFLFTLLCLFMLLSSCSKKIYTVTSGSFIETIDFKKFDLFIFKLKGSNLNKQNTRRTIDFENGLGNKQDLLVYEELYLFMEKEGGKQRVLYFTTLSHKYIYKNGVFNSKLYKKHMPINQIDLLYTGYYDDEELKFYSPNDNKILNINFGYILKDDVLEITKIPNYSAKKRERKYKPTLNISQGDVFGVRMQFEKELIRNFVYEKNGIITPVTKFHHNGNDLYFEIETNSDYKYIKLLNRVKFKYPIN